MKKNLIVVSILLCCAVTLAAQQPIPTPFPTPVRNVSEANNLPRRQAEITDRDPLDDKEWERTFIPRTPYDISKAARAKVKFSREEKALYEKIASDNDLKMVKLFSAPQCAENRLVLNARDEKCAAASELLRVSFYSFLFGYYGESISDFRILEDNLIAGNGRYVHGFLVDLGETEIGRIGKESAEVLFLKDYPAATTSDEESRQRGELEKGFSYQNMQISSRRKLQADHVYLMRIISYRSEGDRASIYNKDSVYVFKISAISADETAVILWRKLFQKNAPRLKNE